MRVEYFKMYVLESVRETTDSIHCDRRVSAHAVGKPFFTVSDQTI